MTLNEVADELSRRLANLFLKGDDDQRPVLKYHPKLATDPHFKDYHYSDSSRSFHFLSSSSLRLRCDL